MTDNMPKTPIQLAQLFTDKEELKNAIKSTLEDMKRDRTAYTEVLNSLIVRLEELSYDPTK